MSPALDDTILGCANHLHGARGAVATMCIGVGQGIALLLESADGNGA
jgi:acetyl-CoA acetyltransferase